MFNVRRLDVGITTGGYRVMLLKEDADTLGLKVGDRVKIGYTNPKQIHAKRKYLICDLGIIHPQGKVLGDKLIKLKVGDIGVYNEVFDKLEMIKDTSLSLVPAKKPESLEHVRLKFNGKIRLQKKHFIEIITDIVLNRYTNVETTFFVLACSAHSLNDKEVIGLTEAMVDAGKHLKFKTKNGVIVDKHCIGGIPGNRTTMVVIPILAAAGLIVPKTSSRSITSPAGTADTMEVLANVNLKLADMHRIVEDIGGCIAWGGSLDLSPADDAIINVEHPLEIDSEGQMIASILSKKKSAGSTHVLLDIPIGYTAKVKTKEHAVRLKKRFTKVGKAVGLNIKVLITDGSQPIGKGIGPYLEAMDVLKVLDDAEDQPYRLRNKSAMMAGHLLEMGGVAKKGCGLDYADELLKSGLAKRKFNEIVVAQGKKEAMDVALYSVTIKADASGVVKRINNKLVASISFIVGCPNDKSSGMYIHKRVGDKVKSGDDLFVLYSNSKQKIKYAKAFVEEEHPFEMK